MNRLRGSTLLVGLAAAAALLPATAPAADDDRADALAMLKRDFRAKGIAGVDRLDADAVQALCNRSGNHPPAELAERLQRDQFEAVRLPAGGLVGDWKAGEKLAQSGRGFTWSDKPGVPAGGNCYNCHRISPSETSFGTVGPSLYQFGKLRGSGPDVQEYVYRKIYNAKAFNLCSEMPRFGHVGALDEGQIKDLVALLLAPDSPVNSQ